jgi:hypothetical protein
MLIIAKGHDHQNTMDQAGSTTKYADLAMRMVVPGVTKSPQDTRKEMKKAMRMRSVIKKTTIDERGQSIPTHQQRTSFTDLVASIMHI